MAAAYERHFDEYKCRLSRGEDVGSGPLTAREWFARQREQEEQQRDQFSEVLRVCDHWKEEGVAAWKSEDLAVAISKWKKADETLAAFKREHSSAHEDPALQDVHSSVLKNRAQA